jgi:hypothetical protein
MSACMRLLAAQLKRGSNTEQSPGPSLALYDAPTPAKLHMLGQNSWRPSGRSQRLHRCDCCPRAQHNLGSYSATKCSRIPLQAAAAVARQLHNTNYHEAGPGLFVRACRERSRPRARLHGLQRLQLKRSAPRSTQAGSCASRSSVTSTRAERMRRSASSTHNRRMLLRRCHTWHTTSDTYARSGLRVQAAPGAPQQQCVAAQRVVQAVRGGLQGQQALRQQPARWQR